MKVRMTRFLGLGMLGLGLALLSGGGGVGCSDSGVGEEAESAGVRHVMIDASSVAPLSPGESVRIDLGAERVLYHLSFDRDLDWSRLALVSPGRAVAPMDEVLRAMQEAHFDPLEASDMRLRLTGDPASFEELSPGQLDELRREGLLVLRGASRGAPGLEPQSVDDDCIDVTVYLPVTVYIDGRAFTYWCTHVIRVCETPTAGQTGCADGQREGFVDEAAWPNIAGCSGAWSIPGLHTENPGFAPACPGLPTFDTATPGCGNAAGDDAADPSGAGCNVADLCAPGWHVCTGDADVRSSSTTGCTGAARGTDPPLFFATRQSTTGCGVCATGASTSASCNANTCAAGCLQTARTSNDFYGCGNFGSTYTCGTLNRFSHNLCSGLAGSSWSCNNASGVDDSGFCEAYAARKSDSSHGGVLCCRDVP